MPLSTPTSGYILEKCLFLSKLGTIENLNEVYNIDTGISIGLSIAHP